MSNADPSTPVVSRRGWTIGVLVACFFVGGLSSLALETAWTKSLSYLLGADLYGAATTIISYMAGLGLGAILAVRLGPKLGPPLRTYALLQFGIGIAGLLSIPALRATAPLFESLFALWQEPALFLTLRFLVTFLILLPATTLMGMTLPTVVGAHGSSRVTTPSSVGFLYGMNTLGAVSGTLLAGFLLVPRLGLTMTCVVAGSLDLCVGAIAFALHVRSRPSTSAAVQSEAANAETSRGEATADAPAAETSTAEPAPEKPFDAGVTAAVLLSGTMALALELCWFRLLGQVIGPTVHAFALTLAVFLSGVGIGSLLGSRWLPRFPSGEVALLTFLLLGVLAAVGPAYFLDDMPGLYATLWEKKQTDQPEAALIIAQVLTACALMLPATLATGAAFPAGVRAYRERVGDREAISVTSGKMFFANTLGSALGTLLWAFFFVPDFGVHGGIRLAVIMALVAAVLLVVTPPSSTALPSWPRTRIVTLCLVALCLVTVLLIPAPNQRPLNAGVYTTIRSTPTRNSWLGRPLSPKAELLFWKEGINGSVAVVSNRYGAGGIDLALSGKWEASTNISTRKSLLLLGHLPMLLAKKVPESSLVIGLGTGMTSGALLQYSAMQRVDIVEIELAVKEASGFFDEYNHRPLEDPRARLIIQDGRTFLWFTRQKYDLITSDPIHPWFKGAANLYTREYYLRAVEQLNPGGIFCQWIPSTMSVGSFHSILATLHSAFPHVEFLFADREIVAVAAREPITYDEASIAARMTDPGVLADLRVLRLTDASKVMDLLKTDLHPIARTKFQRAPINTDDNVLLEHRLPWDTFHGHVVQLRGDAAKKSGKPAARTEPAFESRPAPPASAAPAPSVSPE